jgi:hypothetical protein
MAKAFSEQIELDVRSSESSRAFARVVAGQTRLPGCQWPSVSPQLRPSVLPTGGHVFSPLAATNLPTVRTLEPGQVRGVTPLPAVA